MRLCLAIAILAALGAGCNNGGSSKAGHVTGTVKIDDKPRKVVGCSVAVVDNDNQVTFILDNQTTLTLTDDGLVRKDDTAPAVTITCGSVSKDGRGGSTASSAHEQGKVELDCGAVQAKLEFDCTSPR